MIWSAQSGGELARLGHGGLVRDAEKAVRRVTFSSDGARLATAGGSAGLGYAAVWALA